MKTTPRLKLPIYDHWSLYPMRDWRWPDFSPAELACRGTGRLAIHPPTMDKLQALRDALAKPMIVNSGYRSPEHNARLSGAASRSYHMDGIAFDISMANHDPQHFIEAAKFHGFQGIGRYPQPRNNFVHIDTRGYPATFGSPFPPGAQAFSAATEDRETYPAPTAADADPPRRPAVPPAADPSPLRALWAWLLSNKR